jgi:hypothetical protein
MFKPRGKLMTIKMPRPTTGDKILKFLGKKRGVILPVESYENYGPYASSKAIKESFWKVFFRSKNSPLPENVIDLDSLMNEVEKKD